MALYPKSSMEMFSANGQWSHPCEVRIDGGKIVVSYDSDGARILYEGPEVEPGHFELVAKGVAGKATLHRFAEDVVLDGWWLEERIEGMWRITLSD